MRRPVLRAPLATLRANQLGDLEFHHLRRDGLDSLADPSACSSSSSFLTTSSRAGRGRGRGRRPAAFAGDAAHPRRRLFVAILGPSAVAADPTPGHA
jgi:hypothetical protein